MNVRHPLLNEDLIICIMDFASLKDVHVLQQVNHPCASIGPLILRRHTTALDAPRHKADHPVCHSCNKYNKRRRSYWCSSTCAQNLSASYLDVGLAKKNLYVNAPRGLWEFPRGYWSRNLRTMAPSISEIYRALIQQQKRARRKRDRMIAGLLKMKVMDPESDIGLTDRLLEANRAQRGLPGLCPAEVMHIVDGEMTYYLKPVKREDMEWWSWAALKRSSVNHNIDLEGRYILCFDIHGILLAEDSSPVILGWSQLRPL